MSAVRYQSFLCFAGTPNTTGEFLVVMDSGSYYLTISAQAPASPSGLVLYSQTTMDVDSEMDAIVCVYNAITPDQSFTLTFNSTTDLATLSYENPANDSDNHSWVGADIGHAWTVSSKSTAGSFTLKAYYADGHDPTYMNKTVTIQASSGQIYTVDYNMNGGEASSKPASGNYLDGTDIDLPVQGVRDGYYIDGWMEDRSNVSTNSPYYHPTGSTYRVSKDVTLYAHWTAIPDTFLDSMITSISLGSYYSDSINAPVSSGYEYVSCTYAEKPGWMTISVEDKKIKFEGEPGSPGTYVVDITYTYWLDSPSYQLQERVFWYIYVTKEPQMCTIKFNLDGGTGPIVSSVTAQAGTVIVLPGSDKASSRANSQGDQCPQVLWMVKDHSNQTYAHYNLGSIYKVFDDRTFIAEYQDKVYTIIYDADGGTVANTSHGADAYPVTDGSSLTVHCDNIVKPGYKIGGWVVSTTDHGIVPDGYVYGTVSSSIYVKAHWVKEDASDAYTINFQPGVGGFGTPLTMFVSKVNNDGFKIILPNDNFSKSGYKLIGWDEDRNSDFPDYGLDSTPTPNKDMMLYAIWDVSETPSEDKCRVVFNMNGGQGTASVQNLDVGDHVVRPANPTRNGYVFLGWFYNGNPWDFTNNTISSSMVGTAIFEAQWEQHYVVTVTNLDAKVTIIDKEFMLNGVETNFALYTTTVSWGDGTQDSNANTLMSTIYKSSAYARPGDYTITVSTNVRGAVYSSQYILTATASNTPNIILNYEFTDDHKKIRVDASHSTKVTHWEWYLDGSKLPDNSDRVTVEISQVSDPAAMHTIKLVANYDPSCTGKVDFFFDVDVVNYTVHFELNGGIGDASTDDQQVAEGSTITPPSDPTKEGYVFVGWFNGNDLWDFENTVFNDLTLTAHWDTHVSLKVEGMKVTLTFSKNYWNCNSTIYWDYNNNPTQGVTFTGKSVEYTYDVKGSYKIMVVTEVSSTESLTKGFNIEVKGSAPAVSIEVSAAKMSKFVYEFDASGSTGTITSYSWYVNGKLDSTATTAKYTLTMEPGVKYVVKLVLNTNERYSWESNELFIEDISGEGAKYLAPVCVVIIGIVASVVCFMYMPLYLRYSIIIVIAGIVWVVGVATDVF